ncbi:MAG TPA: hypothetical protein VG826_08135 [Pirellulales bacterium]|nr:hypothetical protein [Pirellulales bacterium]
MKRRIRFTLGALFFAFVVAAAFFEGTQWQYRRDEIRRVAEVEDVVNREEKRRIEEQQAIVNYLTNYFDTLADRARKAGTKAWSVEAKTKARQELVFWQEQEKELRRVLDRK